MINHDIMRFNISVHYSLWMAIIQCLYLWRPLSMKLELLYRTTKNRIIQPLSQQTHKRGSEKNNRCKISYHYDRIWKGNLEKLVNVVADVIISQCWIQDFEICTVHIFKNQTGSFWVLISDNIIEFHNVWASTKILKYFDFPFYLHQWKSLSLEFLGREEAEWFKTTRYS